jgi:RimJ/RimL family protein N-acetyltransferase
VSEVVLRPARAEDCRRVFEWATDPDTRAASFHTDPIPWEDHERWYAASLASESRHLRIAESDGTPAGLVRLDRTEDDEAVEIGINLAPARRGRGLAVPMLLAALAEARTLGFTRVVARIRPDNLRSIRAFERAGFAFAREERVNGSEARRYEATAR